MLSSNNTKLDLSQVGESLDSINTKISTLDEINSKLDNLGIELTGDALEGNVLSGKTFYSNDSKTKLTGTMTNNGAVSQSVTVGGSYTIPAGYHNGSGKVTGPTLSGDAAVGNVLTGKTFYSNSGTKQTGTMTNQGAVSASVGIGGSYTILAGYHNGSGKVSGPTMTLETIVNNTANDTTLTRTYTLSKDYKIIIAIFGSSVGATPGTGTGTLSATTNGTKIVDNATVVGDERVHKIIILNAKSGDTIKFDSVKWFSCYSIYGLV